MNDTKHNTQPEDEDEILPLYDFASGIRGKHAQAYQQGHRVLIHKRNGTTEVQEFNLPEGAVMLVPMYAAIFLMLSPSMGPYAG